ncbi:methyl-accepting chemotaxis sensory transducer [Magnetococcus marinus MC-1]|uniref:Methyl-accepting chemotaxis sensory transducer n=1 Tax=Magnetococcus marinus (strain ATCC BAA-1437 / JCM 17883 / MC-1) TaxID=156889 RepID=A0L8P8_MAGMM|nr:protoglobin domain-containing protein [Magnetococcus marinus]ABK44341.1 methyl-accepting chemotaxis sensory transducer [Magnetococcus marinus MC-1]
MANMPHSHMQAASEPSLDLDHIEQMKRFVGFTEKDASILKKLRPVAAKHATAVVNTFYTRLSGFAHLEKIIGGAGSSVERLKRTQEEYLVQLFDGEYGRDYFVRRWRIGQIHNKIGLEPDWYLGGYSLYRQLLLPILLDVFDNKPKKVQRAMAAIDKILTLDSELAIGSYIDAVMASLRDINVSKTEIEKKVADYGHFIDLVADGDLTPRLAIEGDDGLAQLGNNLNVMTERLAEMARSINSASNAMRHTLSSVHKAVADQSSGAAQQAAAVNETTSTLVEIRTTSSQTLEKASELGKSAERTREVGDRGLDMVEENIAGMQSIRNRVEGIAASILALSKQTQQIGEITGVVAGLAQHSKMLALNASIEAAKAGDSGKGFAVVAAEVKDLAEQSEESTAQVQKILTEIQHATDRAVMATEEGVKDVDQGVILMSRTGEVVRDLKDVIHQSVLSSQQIVAAVRQEAVGIDQVSMAMNEINSVTGQFVEATQKTSVASEDLNHLAITLQDMVARFRI